MIINTTNLNEIRKQIQKLKKEKPSEAIIIKAQDEEFNKKVLEIPGVNVLLAPELHYRKELLKQRDSGLNEHLCKLAKKNNVNIAIDIGSLQKLDKKEKARTLARIIQNINLCKRTKTHIILWPKEEYKKQDIIAFITTLKGSTEMINIEKFPKFR